MVKVLLSPSEIALAKILKGEAITSPLPELKGADILVYTKHGLVGMQRKEVPHDFISSFTDGRMARSMALLVKSCTFTRLVCEGTFRYWPDGTVHLGMTKDKKKIPTRYTRKHIHGMLNDVEFVKGVMVRRTDDLDDTVRYIRSVSEFLSRDKHTGLYSRPSAQGTWFTPKAKDIYLWLLQSFPGIGPTTADNIVDEFGGEIPLAWTCTVEELAAVKGLSKARAKEMWESLPTTAAGTSHRAASGSAVDDLRKLIGR